MASEKQRGIYLPFPELVEKVARDGCKPYAIIDSCERSASGVTGAVDKVGRMLSVPLEPEGRPICRHELGHVRWSLLAPPRVRFDPRVLAAVEDARVNLALRAAGVPVELGEVGDLHIAWLLANDAKRGDGFALFMRSVASVGTSVEPILCAQLARLGEHQADLALDSARRVREVLEKARLRAGGEVAPERRARSLARALARMLRAYGLLDANGVSRSAFVMDCASHIEAPAAGEGAAGASSGKGEEVAGIEPGNMRIARARLTRTLPGARGMRVWRAATEGSVVRHTHRWSIDRAIFRRRVAQAHGTVLLDVSSSMSLADEDLERLLAKTGRGTRVAIYSGKGGEGELRIVADCGRRAEGPELARFGSGNVVDLPALRWLGRQSGPRLWISDGKVTGIGDKSSPRLRALCRAHCQRARIRRVADIDEAVSLLGGR